MLIFLVYSCFSYFNISWNNISDFSKIEFIENLGKITSLILDFGFYYKSY